MKNEKSKLNKGIDEIREIKMTTGEKERVLKSILGMPEIQVTPSPYWSGKFISAFQNTRQSARALVYVLPAILILVLGGGIVSASQKSLPGSLFYPLKVRVVEPVRGALIFSPVKKAQFQIELSAKRLEEAEILLKEDTPASPKRQKQIDEFLTNNAETLNRSLQNVKKSALPDRKNETAAQNF